MYQRTELGATPEVDVDGASTYPQTPVVKAHWEIYDAPEPQTDSFAFGSLKTVFSSVQGPSRLPRSSYRESYCLVL
jgi:hypothetical protein